MREESSFFYVKGTDLEHFFKDLKFAENNYDDDIGSTVLKLGKLNELFAKKVLTYENIPYEDKESCLTIINKINTLVIQKKFKDDESKQKIITYMNELRKERNFEIHADEEKLTSDKYVFRENVNAEDMLKKMHEILKWYLIDLTKQITYISDINFNNKGKFNSYKNTIQEKEREIDNHKKRINELSQLLKQSEDEKNCNIEDLNKLNQSYSDLESEHSTLIVKLKSYESDLEDIKIKAESERRQAIKDVEDKLSKEYNERLKYIKEQGEKAQNQNEIELKRVKECILISNEKIRQLNEEIRVLKDKSENSSKLEAELKRVSDEKAQLECKQNHLNDLLNDYSTRIFNLKNEYTAKLKEKKHEYEQEINIYKDKVQKIKVLKDELNKVEIEKSDFKKIINNLSKKIAEKDIVIKAGNIKLEYSQRNYQDKIHKLTLEKEAQIRKLREEYNSTNEKLKEKERSLIKSEEENLKLKNDIKKIKENSEKEFSKKISEISGKERVVDEQIDKLRKLYEECFNTTRQYQEMLRKSEVCVSNGEKDQYDSEKKQAKIQIVMQENQFNSNLIVYNEKVEETKEEVKDLNAVINEKIFSEGDQTDFYKGFLEVKGEKLRLLYTMISKISMSSIIINKSKEIIFNTKEDEIMDYIEKKSLSLNKYSDAEIRLKIYYKLMEYSESSVQPVYDKKRFMSALDSVINSSYSMLSGKEDFEADDNKIKSIYNYCLDKVIHYFMNRNIDEEKSERANLVDNIYNSFIKLSHDKKEEIREKLEVGSTAEIYIKREINVNPKGFIATVLSAGGFVSILLTDSLLSSISNFDNGILNQGKALKKQIIPLFIMQLTMLSRHLNLNKINIVNYDEMVSAWKKKKEHFDNLTNQKNIKNKVLNGLIKDKETNEDKLEKFTAAEESLYNLYAVKYDEFHNYVLSSDKKKSLSSYESYSKMIEENMEAMKNIKSERKKLGLVKSIFSKEMWKNQSTKLVNDFNMTATEKLLVSEAAKSKYFKEEYAEVLKVKSDLDKTKSVINNVKNVINEKNRLINETNTVIFELQKKCDSISKEYVDIV